MILRIVLAFLFLTMPVTARDLDGRYAASPLKPWFDGLKSEGGGLCCSMSDGYVVEDPDWEAVGDHYRVKIENEWVDVPDENVIKEPNLSGKTMVWPYMTHPNKVRCFLPGSLG